MESYKPNSDSGLNRDEEREVNVMLDQAIKQVERGMSPEEALSTVLSLLPSHLQSEVKRRFTRKLDERKGKPRTSPSTAKQAVGLKQALTLVAQKAYEKILSTFKGKPGLQQEVVGEGRILLRNGVAVDLVRLTEQDLGNLPPAAGIAQVKGQQTQR